MNKKYWRSLNQHGHTAEFRKWVENEFPDSAEQLDNSWSRRSFVGLMGASLALAGLAGCRRPVEKILPFVNPPENVTPGQPLFYATTMPSGNTAYGLVVESHEGRPTKIEGNALSSSTRGKSNLQMQASILDLYDPDRSQSCLHNRQRATWDEFVTAWQPIIKRATEQKGAGFAILSEPFSSPTLARLKRDIEKALPDAQWVAFEPVSDENSYLGSEMAFGRRYRPVYKYENADVILSLESDFLAGESESINAAAGFAAGRTLENEKDGMNRLYVVESLFSVTGASADHRMAVPADAIEAIARALASELRQLGLQVDPRISVGSDELSGEQLDWVRPLAADLARAGKKSLITVGRRQPAVVHALAFYINQLLGAAGTTVSYTDPQDSEMSSTADLADLVNKMSGGEISTLLILGGNPLYNAPSDLGFDQALKKINTSVHLSSHVDETSAATTWHIPRAHFLESWGDARAADGSVGIIQPLIEPLFGGKSSIDLLSLIAGNSKNGYLTTQDTWRREWGSNFKDRWSQALHDGVISSSASGSLVPSASSGEIVTSLANTKGRAKDNELRLLFHADNTLGDGTQANNGWLQELPDPITKLSWDNVATVSPATADRLLVSNEDLIRIDFEGSHLEMPIWVVPGQADNVVGLALGYGRTSSGRIGNATGFNTYTLRKSDSLHIGIGARIEPTGKKYELANTQEHGSMEGRPIVKEASTEEYKASPDFAALPDNVPPLVSLWHDREYKDGYQWGMAIDLTKCNGCSVCTIACQSENNIPIVGKDETRRGREMHWIRIDRYFVGEVDNPQIVHQPVACHHCENAPCEQVCPVAATVHDKEGLNAMVYNRCIGTRYCANNCPYKVRRFNFYNLTKDTPEVAKMANNPEVTVRSRGVMEKCSYCLQRINSGKRTAKLEGRSVAGDEIVVACQQACPADAIVFGNIRDPQSKVTRVKAQNRNYDLLGELNIKPRTSYLAKIRNPNPEMPS